MATPFPGFSTPTASTEAPLEMLAACHIRIQHQCETLQRLADHLSVQGCDAQTQRAAVTIMRYFDTAAIDHHADEEKDLFPALLEAATGSDAIRIRQLIDQLCEEHNQLEIAWQDIRLSLQHLASGQDAVLAQHDVDAFTTRYADHIQREESELLPMASRLLDDQAIERIGTAMRRRRGIADL